MAKILLTGATGFIGKKLFTALCDKDFKVYCWSRKKNGDFMDEEKRTETLNIVNPDLVIHLAWPNLHIRNYTQNEIHLEYALATCSFIEVCMEKNIHFLSLGSVFENHKINFENKYQIAKKQVAYYIENREFENFTWLIPSYIFSFEDLKPSILREIGNSAETEFIRNPHQVQNWIEVRDVVSAIMYGIDMNLLGMYMVNSNSNISVGQFIDRYLENRINDEVDKIFSSVSQNGNILYADNYTRLKLSNGFKTD